MIKVPFEAGDFEAISSSLISEPAVAKVNNTMIKTGTSSSKNGEVFANFFISIDLLFKGYEAIMIIFISIFERLLMMVHKLVYVLFDETNRINKNWLLKCFRPSAYYSR